MSHASPLVYRPDIDGLRAVAVLSVVVFHAFPAIAPGGFTGVDVFFVISGFLISSIIFQGLDSGDFSFGIFYARRVRRIFPALAVVLLASLVAGWLLLSADELNQLGRHVAAGAVFLSNVALMSEAGYFDRAADIKPLLHLWSLGIEEQFYIFWPLLLWGVWKIRRWALWLILVVAALSFYANVYLITREPVVAFYAPFTRFWELICGGLLAWVMRYRQPQLSGRTADILSAAGCALLVFAYAGIRKDMHFPGYWAAIPVAGAVLIIAAGPGAWLNARILSSAPAVWIGLISYSLYLWHWPVLTYLRIIYGKAPPVSVRLLAVAASIGLAWLSVRYIESLFRRSELGWRRTVAAPCLALASLACAGLLASRVDLIASHGAEQLAHVRRGYEHALGPSLYWFEGKNNWLFLGDGHDNTVAKLKLALEPDPAQLTTLASQLQQITATAARYGAGVALLIGPNKSSIYPEHLPDRLRPSPIRYIDLALAPLRQIANLRIHEPTQALHAGKGDGLLYYQTDTHWNPKGAWLAFRGLAEMVGAPTPQVTFTPAAPRPGDLIDISGRKDFPPGHNDSWGVNFDPPAHWQEQPLPGPAGTPFGPVSLSRNDNAPSDTYVWVVGDSFTTGLRPYFNATFRQVRYVGHWGHSLASLPDMLEKADRKPDLIVICRVERSF